MPRTTGTFPPGGVRGDDSETHAATTNTPAMRAFRERATRRSLINDLLHGLTEAGERRRVVVVAVSGGHEAGRERRRRQIDSPSEGSVKEEAEQAHIRPLRVGKIADRAVAEKESP